jgi:hypothetical protein
MRKRSNGRGAIQFRRVKGANEGSESPEPPCNRFLSGFHGAGQNTPPLREQRIAGRTAESTYGFLALMMIS